VVLLIIVVGLGWCFYRALTAAGRAGPAGPDKDGQRQQAMEI